MPTVEFVTISFRLLRMTAWWLMPCGACANSREQNKIAVRKKVIFFIGYSFKQRITVVRIYFLQLAI
jgi:hypothetical protein